MYQSNTQELIGQHVSELTKHGLDICNTIDAVCQKSQQVTVAINQQNHQLLITVSPVFDEKSRIARIVFNLRDMTLLNQLQQELNDAKLLSEKYHLELSELCNRQTGTDSLLPVQRWGQS